MTTTIFIILLILLIILLATAPFEALEWWADWFTDAPRPESEKETAVVPTNNNARAFIVYLTGIAGIDAETRSWRERQLLERLNKQLPTAVIVNNVFPYSMNNEALTGQRIFRWLFRYAARAKRGSGLALAGQLINIRNMAQVAVSVDHRYGPIYNRGSADLIRDGLERVGYPFDDPAPVYLIGYSGGGQIATGAVTYLKAWLNAPIYVISLGGVFSSSRSHKEAAAFYHITSPSDNVEKLGRIFFGRRWPIWRHSHWNRALVEGRAHVLRSHAKAHTGSGSYLDPKVGFGTPKTTFLDETVEQMVGIVKKEMEKLARSRDDWNPNLSHFQDF